MQVILIFFPVIFLVRIFFDCQLICVILSSLMYYADGEPWDSFLHRYMKYWKKRLEYWVLTQDTYPVHVLRYEDLQKDTLGEVRKVLDFLNVSYNPNVLAARLMEDYSEFHRQHGKERFEPYSLEQKQMLRSVISETIELAERKRKAQLLHLNEYLFSIQ